MLLQGPSGAQSAPTKVYTAWKALPAVTDFRWHGLHKKKALPFSTCQVLFSHLSKSKYRLLPTAVKRKTEQKGKVYKS